jgi:murein DD-endopeptidase MepM/ murein hydrolase activator NlpD
MSQEQYGIELDSLDIIQVELGKNQFLADILTPHNVDWSVIDKLAAKSRGVFDIRRMKAGNPVAILKKDDNVHYFIYEKNKADYVVFDLRDSVRIYEGRKKVETLTRKASGTIYSSLFETVYENDLPIELAIKMSEIYAWSIDFFRIQKGDAFRIIFDEQFVDGESIGVSTIHGAWFRHSDEDFYAITFTQDEITDFYDEQGGSLRKAFLKAPLKYSRISSGFSLKRFHPVLKRYRAHLGIDYAAPQGTPIHAVGDGVVLEARYKKGNGNYVKIRHNNTYSTQYLHMSRFAKGIKSGKFVKQGDVIGYVGSTGLATGPHLCFRFWQNNKQVNPLSVDIPPSEPVKEENKAVYAKIRDEMIRALNSIPVVDAPPLVQND